MNLRRCAHLLIEPREITEFDLEDLMTGGVGLRRRFAWVGLVPWRTEEVELDAGEVAALAALSESEWRTRSDLETSIPSEVLDRLREQGLALSDGELDGAARARDQAVRDQHWAPVAAVSHYFGRWTGVDDDPDTRPPGYDTMQNLIAKLGDPPAAVHTRGEPAARIPLPVAPPTSLDALWTRRVTCRNFDTMQSLSLSDLGRVLGAVFGVQGRHGTQPCEEVVKKHHPSGGALHPLEAYVLVQRVQGLVPGLYHFHAGDRALEPLPDVPDIATFARVCVGGQRYLAEAPVLVIMAMRFARCFWKYRRHAKAYRTLLLEAGHASQNLYLAATERGLGAFITAAINEIEIEQGFGLDPLQEGVVAVCGIGARAAERTTAEFDPLKQVWSD